MGGQFTSTPRHRPTVEEAGSWPKKLHQRAIATSAIVAAGMPAFTAPALAEGLFGSTSDLSGLLSLLK